MDVLLDTHAFLWAVSGDRNLSLTANDIFNDQTTALYLSLASLWEVAIKHSRGRIVVHVPPGQTVMQTLLADIHANHVAILPIQISHLAILASLSYPASGHKDLFDRTIIAQAMAQSLPVVSRDRHFDDYPVQRVW